MHQSSNESHKAGSTLPLQSDLGAFQGSTANTATNLTLAPHRIHSFHCQTMCLCFTFNTSYVQGDDWVPDWGYNKVGCLCIQSDAMLADVFVLPSLHYCMSLLLSASIKALFD
jgi:hypothetical protein